MKWNGKLGTVAIDLDPFVMRLIVTVDREIESELELPPSLPPPPPPRFNVA